MGLLDGIAGIIDTGAQFGVQAINNNFQREMLNRQLDYNTQMYQQQYNDTLAMYERQLADSRQNTADERAWNSESSQVQRMKAAGLNPALQNVGSSGTSAASTPGMTPPQKQPINFADFAPKFALGMETFTNMLSAIEDLRGKRIANRDAETGSIDEALQSVFEIDDLEKVAQLVGGENFPDIVKDVKGHLRDGFSIDGNGGTLDAAVVTADSKLVTAANKIYAAVRDQGYNRRNAKRMTVRALRRLGTAEFKAKYMADKASYTESSWKSTTNQSQYGYDDYGNVTDILADVFSTIARSSLDSYKRKGNEDAVRGALYDKIRQLQEYKGKGKIWAQIAAVLISAYLEVGSGSVTYGPKGRTTSFGF